MRKTTKSPIEKIVKDIKRTTRKRYSSEEKVRIILEGLRGADNERMLNRGAMGGFSRAFTADGRRTSWKPERSVWRVTSHVLRRPMTAFIARSITGKRYPYLNCLTLACSEYRKSIRAEKIDAGFE